MKIGIIFFGVFLTLATGQTNCGSFSDGTIYYNPVSDVSYFQCNNGYPVLVNCPSGFIFAANSNMCVNPCLPAGMADGANVMDPNNDGNFYTCSGGKVTGSSQSCPDGSKFYQALADLPDKGCWDPKLIPAAPPGSAYAAIPIFPQGESCSITNYYVEYYNGIPTVKKCPSGSLVYEGACMAAVTCDPPIACICA